MKKLLATVSCSLLILGCSDSVKVFDCDGTGLVIQDKKLTYGPIEYNFCGKQGNWSIYSSTNCDKKEMPLAFDEITYQLTLFNINGISGDKKCNLKK